MLRAGLRSSSYGPQKPFPEPEYWAETAGKMAELFAPAIPAVVWIVGEMKFHDTTGISRLNFARPEGMGDALKNIVFAEQDKNEPYLDLFDRSGVKVWLQVEPDGSDMLNLIDLVLGKYCKHPSVIGFGVDVEWYKWEKKNANEGTAVTDAEAKLWSERVRSFNPAYQLFLKHWEVEKMPPKYREGIMFINDSQGFKELNHMADDFNRWGKEFTGNPVGFQFGYKADKPWWGELANPPQEIGKALIENIPNLTDLFWVDFTMEQLWPRAAE